VILTLKLNHWKFADEIPGLLKRLKKMGFKDIRAAQLSFHHREIGVVGLF
jgi:hypothetical protein